MTRLTKAQLIILLKTEHEDYLLRILPVLREKLIDHAVDVSSLETFKNDKKKFDDDPFVWWLAFTYLRVRYRVKWGTAAPAARIFVPFSNTGANANEPTPETIDALRAEMALANHKCIAARRRMRRIKGAGFYMRVIEGTGGGGGGGDAWD